MHQSIRNNRKKRLHQTSFSTSSSFYQIWKIVIILITFYTSFEYANLATFQHVMTDEAGESFEIEDVVYITIFVLDMIVHFLVREATRNE